MGFKCGIVGLPNVGKSTLFNALTETAAAQAANYPFCTIEPNVGEVAVPDPRLDVLAKLAQVRRDHADAAHLRGHRRAGEGRVAGRGARQPVPRQHPRGRRDRACGALLRRRRGDARRRQDRSGRRHRDDRDRADARRPRQPGAARRRAGKEDPRPGQGSEGNARSRAARAHAAARRQAGAFRRAQARGREAVSFARPADLAARALRLQRRGGRGRDRQRLFARGREARRRRGRGLGRHLGQDRVRDRGAAARGARDVSLRDRPEGARASIA